MLKWINKESWEMTKMFLPEAKQVKKSPTTTVRKICTYVQNGRKQSNDSFGFPPESENIFSTSYFYFKNYT